MASQPISYAVCSLQSFTKLTLRIMHNPAVCKLYKLKQDFIVSHFLLPLSLLQDLEDAPFYSNSDESETEDEEEEEEEEEGEEGEGKKKKKKKKKKPKKKPYVMDSDHRMLLRNCKPLLQSRNASVSHMTDLEHERLIM